jgi:hypothetical protein
MRKYLIGVVALSFLLFALGLMAQYPGNSGQTTNPQSGTSSSQNPNSPPGDETGKQAPSTSSGSQSSMGSEHQGKTKTVEGCVVREESDYFLIPKHGNPVRLDGSGANDVSAHLNHRVKIHGNESAWSGAGSSAGTTGGTSGSMANPSTSEPSTSSSTAGSAGTTGSVSGSTSPGASASGTTSGTGNLHSVARNEIAVERIDMVSESCPANWNSNYKNGTWTGSSTGKSSSEKPSSQY